MSSTAPARIESGPTEDVRVSAPAGALGKEIADLKTRVAKDLGELARHYADVMDAILGLVTRQEQQLGKLQEAVEASKKRLENQHRIEVAADTLEQLVAETEEKKASFAREHARKAQELEEDLAARRRAWQREDEQQRYELETKRKREDAAFAERSQQQEAELKRRREALEAAEAEVQRLKKDAGDVPSRVEREVAARQTELARKLDLEHKRALETLEKDRDLERRIAETRLGMLEEQNRRLEAEATALRKEMEAANKNAHELALRVIAGAGKEPTPPPAKRPS